MKLQDGCGKNLNLQAVNKMGVDSIIYFLKIYSDCTNAIIDCEECPLKKVSCLRLQNKVLSRSINLLKELDYGECVK